MSRAIVWATVDRARGIAVITGQNHDELVHEVAPQAKWSRPGRGWILTLAQVSDLACLCDIEHAVFRERVKKP